MYDQKKRVVWPLPEAGSAAAEGSCMNICFPILQAPSHTEAIANV